MDNELQGTDESMLVVLFILAILFGVLMILTVAICCYICARRCWIKRWGDVHDSRFFEGHQWWSDNRRSATDRKVPLITSHTPVNRKVIGGDNGVSKSAVMMVGCSPGGCRPGGNCGCRH